MSPEPERSSLQIALIHPDFRPDGGAERMILHTLSALAGQVHITIVARRRPPAAGDWDFITCNPFHLGRLWREWSFERGVCRALRGRQFDLVQSQVRLACCHLYRTGGGVHRQWLHERDRKRGSWSRLATQLSPYQQYKLAAERRMYASPMLEAVICNSQMVKDEIRHYFGLPEERLPVIRNAIDQERFRPATDDQVRRMVRTQLGIGLDDIVYAFVGSGFERKGLDLLLEVLAELPADSHLLVVGKDKDQRAYMRQARRLGLAGRMHFVGVHDDVRPYYWASDVFALPTLYDSFALTVLEAMACGLPVVSSHRCGAAVDLIRSGENGLICDALDRVALVDHLRALRDAGLRARLGQAGRASIAHLTLANMRQELLALYRRLTCA